MFSALVAATTFTISSIAKANAMKKTAKETYEAKDRLLDEAIIQREENRQLYDTQTSLAYGNDFLTKLRQGADSETLIQSIGQDTAIGKQLADYDDQARLAVSNAHTSMTQQGAQAAISGKINAQELHSLEIQGEQAEAQAIASQATSGIRSTGTGDNLRKMQVLDNEIALNKARYQIDASNTKILHNLSNTQISATQKADALRTEKDIKAKSTLEKALSGFAQHTSDDADAQRGITNLTNETNYWQGEKNKSGWDLFWGN